MMNKVISIGTPPWSREDMLADVDEFLALYEQRPVKDNAGGMKAPHMFALWFMARRLNPEFIVESGIYKGQSTWLLEQACPQARIFSIDVDLSQREYISARVDYSSNDFSLHDWHDIPERTLVFFDDHQNAYKRMQQCRWFGFRHVIFEDNYPVLRGDCYSLKKAFAHAGFSPDSRQNMLNKVVTGLARLPEKIINTQTCQFDAVDIAPNDIDARMLTRHLDVYYEFPPLVKTAMTRWGDEWSEAYYPTQPPLLERPLPAAYGVLEAEAASYNWMCYARLR